MSLINDALRRAKQAQKEAESAPPPPIPHFRPVDPVPQAGRHGLGLLLPGLLGLVALLALLLLWELSRRGASETPPQSASALNVSAKVLPVSLASDSEVQPAIPSHAGETEMGAAAKPAAANTFDTKAPAKERVLPVTPAVTLADPHTNLASGVATSSEPNPGTEAQQSPAPLKLQGIVFNPKRPSALINGRVMFVGERIRELRLTAIHADYVVLIGGSRTNVLSLEP